jgi:hypothetical protein
MMNRRQFLKTAGLCGLSLAIPPFILKQRAMAALPDGLDYTAPGRIPQIIHVFLYGGPSELAGNLTNISEISANSQNSYPGSVTNNVTNNKFWSNAGGDIMEQMLTNDKMSIYRTVNRVKDTSRAHGHCVTQNLVGHLNLSNAGIATTLAAIVDKYKLYERFDKSSVDELVLPFVSFEGDSLVFSPGNLDIPMTLRPMNLDSNFDNPYARSRNWTIDADGYTINEEEIDGMARQVSEQFPQFEKINNAFRERAALAKYIDERFSETKVLENLPFDPDTNAQIAYPGGNFGNRLRAAVSLAVNNPETVFISMGSGGLGGWDDHSNGLANYPGRMNGLMAALQVASRHLELMNADNVVINVFGDFGRNVNLNDAGGWDHGNNQNLYTIGGAGLDGRENALGRLVGKTQRIAPYRNRQFTAPTDDSYRCEPFSIASSIFKYFGIQNPELLTGEPAIDESENVNNERV